MKLTKEVFVNNNKISIDLQSPSNRFPGEVILKATQDTPDGFLKCNGGIVSRTLYKDLYDAIGTSFNYVDKLGNGKPYTHQYQINNQTTPLNSTWPLGTNLAATNAYFTTIMTKRRLYILGRFTGSSYATSTYTATIDGQGVIGTWVATTSIPLALLQSESLTFNSAVYTFGGYDGTYKSNVYTAPITADGTLGPWVDLPSLPFTLAYSQVLLVKNRIYIIGGYQNGSASNKVYYSIINSDGTLGTWVQSVSLANTLSHHKAVYLNNRLYVIGGKVNGSDNKLVVYGNIDSTGELSSWNSSTSLPSNVTETSLVCTTNSIYLLGGKHNSSGSTTILAATINTDESLGAWTNIGTLSEARFGASAVVTGTRVYLLGGYVSSTVKNTSIYCAMPGGLNDTSEYFGKVKNSVNPVSFALPDYTYLEEQKLYAFIKYDKDAS